MKNRQNAANQLARDCMVTALIKLLKKKKISEISITELTVLAGVSRMTFYRNYETKEDIIIQHMEEVFERYNQEYQDSDLGTNLYDSTKMEGRLNYFSDNYELLNTLFNCGMGYLFLDKLTEYVLRVWNEKKEDKEQYYKLLAFSGSLYNICRGWFQDQTAPSAKEMACMLQSFYTQSDAADSGRTGGTSC